MPRSMQLPRRPLRVSAEEPSERRSGDLQVAPILDPAREVVELAAQVRVALGVADDRIQPGL